MKIEYQPKGQQVYEVEEKFTATEEAAKLQFVVFMGRVHLRGWDSACAHYSDLGFLYDSKGLTVDLLRKFLKAYDDARAGK